MSGRFFRTLIALLSASACFSNSAYALSGSWQAHLARLTTTSKCSGGLYGQDGVEWAASTGVKVEGAEVKEILGAFGKPKALSGGIRLIGVKYIPTSIESNTITLKSGTKGVVWVKSPKAVSACFFDESQMTPAQARTATSRFADYIKSIGY